MLDCTGSVMGIHDPDRSGECVWCGKIIEEPYEEGTLEDWEIEEDQSYRYFYDPNFGTDKDDAY